MLSYSTMKSASRRATTSPACLQKKEYSSASTIQTKLTVGKANDKYEQEADRVADQVVSSPTTTGPAVQKKCTACEGEEKAQMQPILQKKDEEEVQAKPFPSIMKMEEEEPQAKLQMQVDEELQTKQETATSSTETSTTVENKIKATKGHGSPMDEGTRSFMEERIGSDFSKVRIHTDTKAIQMNRELGAQAFATGNDIYFGKAKYSPKTKSGQHLLAHELTHVVQQKGIIQPLVQRQPKPKKVETAVTPEKAPTAISETIKRKIVATALAEAHTGQDSSIASIYINLYKASGESGLKKSAAYSHKSDNYKIYMLVLGDKSYANDKPTKKWLTVKDPKTKKERRAKSIQEYVNHSPYFKNVIMGESRAKSLKAIVDVWILTPAAQPHRGWLGQGNLNDINNVSSKGIYWKRARAYFWVQKGNDKAAKYVKVLPAGKRTQFVFDSLAIQKYYQKHKMPASVKKITVNDL